MSDEMERDRKKTHHQQIHFIEKVESLSLLDKTSPREEVIHADANPDAGSWLEKRVEETSYTAVKGARFIPSPDSRGEEEDGGEEAPNTAEKRNTPPPSSDSEPEPDPVPIFHHWRYIDILFDPHRRGNGCYVTWDCDIVLNSELVNDCPDMNRKAGTWGCERLHNTHLDASQYWYLSIRVFPRGQDTFPGTLCEVGLGTEYALYVIQPVYEEARTRYVKSTRFLNYATIQRLAQTNDRANDRHNDEANVGANDEANSSQGGNEQRPLHQIYIGIYWNTERRRVHILHLKQNGFALLYRGVVSNEMDVWPVVSVTPLYQCNAEVEIRALRAQECPFAPDIYQPDLQDIIGAPV